MGKFRVDWGLNVANVITFGVMLLGAIVANERRLATFDRRSANLEIAVSTLVESQKQQSIAMKEYAQASAQLQIVVAQLVIKVDSLYKK